MAEAQETQVPVKETGRIRAWLEGLRRGKEPLTLDQLIEKRLSNLRKNFDLLEKVVDENGRAKEPHVRHDGTRVEGKFAFFDPDHVGDFINVETITHPDSRVYKKFHLVRTLDDKHNRSSGQIDIYYEPGRERDEKDPLEDEDFYQFSAQVYSTFFPSEEAFKMWEKYIKGVELKVHMTAA